MTKSKFFSYLVVFFSLFSLTSCSSLTGPKIVLNSDQEVVNDLVFPRLDTLGWTNVTESRSTISNQNIVTYYDGSFDDDSWISRLTLVRDTDGDQVSSAYDYYRLFLKPEVDEECYAHNPNLTIFEKTNDTLTFQYRLLECGKNANQIVVGKIFKFHDHVSVISYATKTDYADEETIKNMHQFIATRVEKYE